MKFLAEINVMPHKGLLDPQGKAVTNSLNANGFKQIENVRVGKRITLEIEAANEEEAKTIVETSCKKLLVNAIMESFEFSVKAL